MLNKKNLKDIYTLSPMQEGMLFHSELDKKSSAYIEQSELLLSGDFNAELFAQSWQTIIERHDVFRSIFVTKNIARPIQVVLKTVSFTPVCVDLSLMSADEVHREIEDFRQQDINTGFDLATGPLFRLAMFTLPVVDARPQTKVFWTFHHIIMDGWSLGLVLNELFNIYSSLKYHKLLTLPPPVAYNKYIKWLATQNLQSGLDFWAQRLKTIEQQTRLPQRSDSKPGFEMVVKPLSLDQAVFDKIKTFCQQQGLTLNNYVQSVWALCLNLYTGQDKVVFGKTVAGRSAQLPQAEDIVGLLINTLPVYICLRQGESFVELVKRVQQEAFDCDQYDWCSLAAIQNETALKSELINHIIVFENYPLDTDNEQWKSLKLGFKMDEVSGIERTNYNFEIIAMPTQTLNFDVKYNRCKFDDNTINTLMSSFLALFQKSVEFTNSDYLKLNVVDNADDYLTEVNDCWHKPPPLFESVLAQFERQVQENPQGIALTDANGISLSYAELDKASSCFAAGLAKDYQVKAGQLIAVLVNHNHHTIISFLGIIKAGAAYLPMDPNYPQDKLDFMLQDSGCQLLLLDDAFSERTFPRFNGKMAVFSHIASDAPLTNVITDLDACIYVIYTSGSTGTPKGCQIAHRNLASLISNSKQNFGFNQNDRWVVAHSLCFDFSVWEMYGALCFGGTLHLPSRDVVADTKQFYHYLVDHKITVLNQTPAAFYQLIAEDELQQKPSLQHIHTVCFGGDRLDLKPLQSWAEKYPLDQTKLINMFGITETTVHVSYKRITDADLENNNGQSPIGVPLANVSMLLLDKFGRLVPNNVVGEIYVGGAGVGLGYLNREELNQERFVPNPYNVSETLYRTGDLAKRYNNGEMIYLGRNDFQVQIRGFRIELGEIAYRLQQLPEIKDAVVLAAKDGERTDRLIAFYIAAEDQTTNLDRIKSQLRQDLADYMIPAQIYALHAFPLTANNKIDRGALLALEADVLSQGLAQSYVAPRNALEHQITAIWQSLLELKQVGVEDDFFDIGGHSIKATLLVTQLSKALSVDFSLKEVFEIRTVAGLAHRAQFKQPSLYAQIEKIAMQPQYELSYAQKRLWTLDRVLGGAYAYNLHGAFIIKAAVDLAKVEQAFGYLLQRHEALRLAFVEIDGTPYQHTQSADNFSLLTQSVATMDEARVICQQEIEWTFNLAKGDLFRVKLLSLPHDVMVMSLCLHHIIADGWSIGVLLNEFTSVYLQLCTGKQPDLTPLPIQFKDFTHWQNEAIRTEAMNDQRDYWLEQLSGELPVLELPSDYPRPNKKSFAGKVVHFELPKVVFEQLQAFHTSKQLTLFMGLIGFYHLLLFKYTGQRQIIIGIPISGRYHPDLNDQIGYYLNTLPIKLEVEASDSIEEYFKRLKETVKNAFDHQVYPFDEMVDKLQIENSPSRSGLYDVMFTLQNYERGELKFGDTKAEVLAIDSPTSKFDLTMVCEQSTAGLKVDIEYATDLFKAQTISNMQQHFVQLMQSALATPHADIGQLNMLSIPERNHILEGFNAGAKLPTQPPEQTIIDVFQQNVRQYGDKMALSGFGETLSYRQLDDWSNQISQQLHQTLTMTAEDRIAIYVDRSHWMIACIIGVLKSGAAYVPIDPKDPEARAEFLLKDSHTRLILTQSHYVDVLSKLSLPLLTKHDVALTSIAPLGIKSRSNDLAYIMYTSGSSGAPKGVLVEQQSVIALVKDSNYTDVKPLDRLLQLSNYAFDGSVYDIFAALLSGASLHLTDHDMLLSPSRLCDFIRAEQVNITFITTALINTLIDIEPQIISQFDKIYFGGQEASLKHIQTALEHRKARDSIVHVYGPTETTTFCAYHIVESVDTQAGNIPIGTALSQKQLYVLDQQLQVVPVGVTGEIYISGVGVARAYLNRPLETKKAFLPNPFDARYQLYKTNDLGRWNSDGQIEFLGRKDQQVKIRGFRVEIGEVENAILRHKALAKVFVMAWSESEGANKQLVAYYVCHQYLSKQALRNWLSGFLPDHMVPAYFIKLDALPLNSNGKVERKKLPDPTVQFTLDDDHYVAATTPMEKVLAGVWSSLLGRDKISIQDNYFTLGGDSIKAIQMIAALQRYQFKLEVKDLYAFATIETLAPCLVAVNAKQNIKRLTGEFALTAIQSWFLNEKNGPLDFFNQDMLLRWLGPLDLTLLTQTLNAIIDFHDLLRGSLTRQGQLLVKDQLTISIEGVQLEDDTEQLMIDTTRTLNEQMDLAQGPLLIACTISRPDGQYLYLVAHHMIIDGISWRILLDDLHTAYTQKAKNLNFVRTSPAKAWVDYLVQTEHFSDQLDYWMSRDTAAQGMLSVHVPDNYQVSSEQSVLDADMTNKLLTSAHHSFNTQINDLLLFPLAQALQDIHGQQNSLIYLEGHGREALDNTVDLSRTIGWFTSMYPVSIASMAGDDTADKLKRFKEQLRDIPDKGLGYGVLKYLHKAIDKEYQASASFNYLGQFDSPSQQGQASQDSLFELSGVKTAKTCADHLTLTSGVDIVAYVESGQLQVSVYYAYSPQNQRLVADLLEAYLRRLQQIITFCCDTDSFSLTPSDIDFDGFDIDSLDTMLDNLE